MSKTALAFIWGKWILLVLGGFVVLAWLSLKSYRRSVRKRLVRYLQGTHPELEIVAEHSDHLTIRVGEGDTGRMNLHNLFMQIANARPKTPEDEEAIFKALVNGVLENIERACRPMSLEDDGDFLLPRLVNERDLASLLAQAKLAHQPLAGTGLSVVYVRDSKDAVAYVSEKALADLNLEVPTLHERALANLRKKSSSDFARGMLKKNSLAVLKLGDTFEAARLLLIPEQLLEGETLAAAIPDRDTLAILPPPADGNWSGLTKLSRSATGRPLLNRPLKVTRDGFELMGDS